MRLRISASVGLVIAIISVSLALVGGGRGPVADVSSLAAAQAALRKTGSLVATPSADDNALASKLAVTPPDNGGNEQVATHAATLTDGTNGTTNAMVQAEDGDQFLTVIKDASAPESFTYGVDLPDGGSISVAEDGSRAVVFDGDHKAVGFVDQAWAKDANGDAVNTRYVTDGKTLTQVVDHRNQAVVYPIVADPYFRWYWNGLLVTLTRNDMAALLFAGIQSLPLAPAIAAIPGVNAAYFAGLSFLALYASWAYANHKCGWIWISPAPNKGWYDC